MRCSPEAESHGSRSGRSAVNMRLPKQRPTPFRTWPGLSCRWDIAPAKRGLVLSLIVTPRGDDPRYSALVEEIVGTTLDAARSGRPITVESLGFAAPEKAIALETGAISASGVPLWKAWATAAWSYLIAAAFHKFKLKAGGFDMKIYAADVAANADFRKFDDGLRMTLDCTPAFADALEARLAAADDFADWGLFRQKSAQITCFVPSIAERGHCPLRRRRRRRLHPRRHCFEGAPAPQGESGLREAAPARKLSPKPIASIGASCLNGKVTCPRKDRAPAPPDRAGWVQEIVRRRTFGDRNGPGPIVDEFFGVDIVPAPLRACRRFATLPRMEASRANQDLESVVARLTPMMAQYFEIKAANPDCLLFYRMGDFYELFFDDAEVASRALGIVLTKRGKHEGEDIRMCGVPVERADDYLNRLIALGHRVAVCEQLEDPAEAKKRGAKSVVRRDVVRLVTPGTITEERLLEPGRARLLVAVQRVRANEARWTYGLAALDLSTGAFSLSEADEAGLAAELARLEPSEIVAAQAVYDEPPFQRMIAEMRVPATPLAREAGDGAAAERQVVRILWGRDARRLRRLHPRRDRRRRARARLCQAHPVRGEAGAVAADAARPRREPSKSIRRPAPISSSPGRSAARAKARFSRRSTSR